MATFLTREDIVKNLHRIIDEADRELVLISPYIRLADETKSLLKSKTRRTNIRVISRRSKSTLGEKPFLDSLGKEVSFLSYLHAKCYLNDREALLTSMNIDRASQERNHEIGILVSKQDDSELYGEIYELAKRYWTDASGELYSAGSGEQKAPEDGEFPREGFCIRCADDVSIHKQVRPYCRDCYDVWNQYKKYDYEDDYCHTCGREWHTSMRRPLCIYCHRQYRDSLEFPVDPAA